jgi:hypothetical protein
MLQVDPKLDTEPRFWKFELKKKQDWKSFQSLPASIILVYCIGSNIKYGLRGARWGYNRVAGARRGKSIKFLLPKFPVGDLKDEIKIVDHQIWFKIKIIL